MKQTQFERVRTWATVRGLYEKGDPKTQFVKLIEEVGETGRAILKSDEPEIKDGLGDAFVVLVNLAHLCGYTLEECIEEALEVIEKRTGKMVDGTFIKDE
jgi:NTP pyrophosphatase (non-canonical NTP hydrolase)